MKKNSQHVKMVAGNDIRNIDARLSEMKVCIEMITFESKQNVCCITDHATKS